MPLTAEPPAKAIPPTRDRLQSRVLVSVFSAVLLLTFPYRTLHHPDKWLWLVLGVSLTFALLVRLLRAATTGGAIAGGAVCFCITFLTGNKAGGLGRSGLGPLLALFILTYAATKLGRRRKEQAGLAESRRGRTAAQVIANLGAAALIVNVTPLEDGVWAYWMVMPLACLAEAVADTVASEIGQAFGGTPRLFPSLRKVPAGTDGAMSITGTLAGAVASALLMLAAHAFTPSFMLLTLAWTGGMAGLFFDTILGATVERKGWLGNDLVNFSSTVFAAVCALLLCTLAKEFRF